MGDSAPASSTAKAPVAIGDVLVGKYRIDSVIGEGGMGTVYSAHHELLDVSVAVKVLPSSLVDAPGVVDRFLREARAVARLKSEHVARVMDIGTLDGGQPYIVMELLEGEDLRDRLARLGALPVRQSVDYIMQALEAMAHAHAAGIVHRDLKPENLFVATTSDGRDSIRVLDFGIAKLSQAGGGRLTAEHTLLGSPHYMSPEQVRDSSQIDPRSDVWALGAILYELVTGKEAFHGETAGEVFASVLHATPTSMCLLRPDVPLELDAAVALCLKRDMEGRFANVAELAYALAPLASDEWRGHAERIEQILTRPQRLSDPPTGVRDSGPVSVRRMRAQLSSIPSAAPPESGAVARASVRAGESVRAAPEPVASVPARTSRHARWARVFLDALVATVTIVVLARGRPHAPRVAAVIAPGLGERTALTPPAVSLEPLAPTALEPRASSYAPSAPAAPASIRKPVDAPHRNAAPSKHAGGQATSRPTAANPQLPGILTSPE